MKITQSLVAVQVVQLKAIDKKDLAADLEAQSKDIGKTPGKKEVQKVVETSKKAQKEMWDHVASTGHKGGSITLPVVVANGKVFLTPTRNLGKFINDIKNACKATK